MRNLEIIQHIISDHADLSVERLQMSGILAGIDTAAEYDMDDKVLKCKIYALVLSELSNVKGVQSETEGGYSVTYSTSDASILGNIARLSGCPDLIALYTVKRTAVDKSYLW